MKTSALFNFSCSSPFILAQRTKKDIIFSEKYGELYGLIFQIVDDIIDETQTFGTLGKTPGKDKKQGKSTFISHLNREKAILYCNKKVNNFINKNKFYFNKWNILEKILLQNINKIHYNAN